MKNKQRFELERGLNPADYTSRKIFFRLGRLVLKRKFLFAWAICAMLVYSVVTSAFPGVLREIVDNVGPSKAIPKWVYLKVSLGILAMTAIRGFAYYWQNFLMLGLGQTLNRDLRELMFRKLIFMPFGYFNRRRTGDLLSRFTTDISYIEQAFVVGVTGPFRDLTQIFFLLGYLATLNLKLFLLCFTLLFPTAYLINFFGKRNKKISDLKQTRQGRLSAIINEVITGVRIVKAFHMELYEIRKFTKENTSVLKQFFTTIRIASLSTPFLELVAALYIVAVLAYGSYLIELGEFTTGAFLAFVTAFFMVANPIRGFNGFYLKMAEATASARRIFEILDTPNPQAETLPKPEIQPIHHAIHIKIKSFGYHDKIILHDIDLTIQKGEKIAVVGQSGSGKTTLINLLPRFYDLKPSEGFISFDDQNIQNYSLSSLRKLIGIVSQDTILFNDSVKYNIAYGNVYQSMDSIRNASNKANASEFIDKFEHGYDQMIGERGMAISGGQRQRLAIARAILKDSPILILDEATSSLDTQAEQEVNQALNTLMQGRTTIMVSHKILSTQDVDRIYVMKEGTIIESGSFQELLNQDGYFRKLYNLSLSPTGYEVMSNPSSEKAELHSNEQGLDQI